MEYTIYADNDLIYNRRICDENGNPSYPVISPFLNETTDSFCSLTYTAKRGTPAYNLSVEMIPRIKVYEDGDLYWTGRVLKSTPNINAEKEVYVEDFLGVLCDSMYRPFEFYGTPAELLQNVVTVHNSQVSESQQIYAVVCDITSENIVRSSEGYNTCWQIVKQKLLDTVGGYMWFEYDSQERAILHYSLSARNASTQRIQFGKNLTNYKVEYDFDGFYTALIPLGAKDSQTKQYVTIESVNNGNDYLIDTAHAAIYGIIYAPANEVTWKDVHEPSILLTRAQAWLQNRAARLIKKIDLEAHDLSGLNVDLRAFHWLDSVPVEASEIDDTFIIKNLSRPLDRPLQLTISMGDSFTSFTGASVSQQSATIERIENIEADYTTDGETRSIAREEIRNDTSIIQRAEEIISTALEEYVKTNDYETFVSSVQSQLVQMAGDISANFTASKTYTDEVDGVTRTKVEEVYSFIRLLATIPGEQDGGIVIGESTSEIKLKLENDILYFFMGDEKLVTTDTAIAWFKSNQLNVNNSTIQNLTLGIQGQYLDARIVGTGDNRCVLWSGRLS